MLKRMIWIIVILMIGVPLVGTIVLRAWASGAERPTNLGVTNGQLAPCPDSPNCVATQGAQPDQQMAPLPYTGTVDEAKARLLQVIQALPRATSVANEGDYLAFVFRSQLIGYPDDVEFRFDDNAKVIHFRSASRLGRGDMGVNRARMEAISQAFAQQ